MSPPHALSTFLPIRNTRSKLSHPTLYEIACSNLKPMLPTVTMACAERARERETTNVEGNCGERGRSAAKIGSCGRCRLLKALLLWVSCARAMTQSPALGPASIPEVGSAPCLYGWPFHQGGMSCVVSAFLFLSLFFQWSLRTGNLL